MKRCIAILFILFIMTSCSTSQEINENKEEIIISAASSLTNVLQDIIATYEEAHPDVRLTLNLGSSGKLMQQIQQGAPTDLFLSADEQSMDQLENKGLILPETRVNFVHNQLVVIQSKEGKFTMDQLTDLPHIKFNQLAVGNPDSVPVGMYAKEALKSVGIWTNLQDKSVFAKDARQVLTYVASGNVELGFVYQTDVLIEDSVEELLRIDTNLHRPIVYPGAVTTESGNPQVAAEFLDFLSSNEAQSIFAKHGFN